MTTGEWTKTINGVEWVTKAEMKSRLQALSETHDAQIESLQRERDRRIEELEQKADRAYREGWAAGARMSGLDRALKGDSDE